MSTVYATTAPAAALRRHCRGATKPRAAPLRVQALAEPRSAAKQQKQSSLALLGQAALAASLSALVAASTIMPEVAFAVRVPPTRPPLPFARKTSNLSLVATGGLAE